MIYLYLNDNHIKLLCLKKTILGQHESYFFEKKHEARLLDKGKIINVDILASAIKEALSLTSASAITEKDVILILSQEVFYFLRTDLPVDIAPPAMSSFIIDKARANLSVDIDNCTSDYFIQTNQEQKFVTFYAISKDDIEKFKQTLTLLGLKLNNIIPDSLSYFKLFEKTLRKEKKENILYAFYDKNKISGYLYDSFGLLLPQRWSVNLSENQLAEDVLKNKAIEFENNNNKLNRIILSGNNSENVRQDTFTKAVGVWTNPLKRIIPDFYSEYLKLLVVDAKLKFPLLSLDVCFGAFIFTQENKNFSLLKNGYKNIKKTAGKITLPKKEIAIFICSFVLSFILFLFISRLKFNPTRLWEKQPPLQTKITPSPLPATPTPTISTKKEEIKIKILNGSGIKGKAIELKDILKNKGYQEILTGNADNFDFENSEIQVKKSKIEIINLIKNDLKDTLEIVKQSDLDEKETADVIITFGKDFK